MSQPAILIKLENDEVVETLTIAKFLEFMNKKFFEHDKVSVPNLCRNFETGEEHPYQILKAELGRKYIRLYTQPHNYDIDGKGQRSCYAFLDYQGNIYMSAGWKAPSTKHVRGTVWDENHSWGKALNRYGAAYMPGRGLPEFDVKA